MKYNGLKADFRKEEHVCHISTMMIGVVMIAETLVKCAVAVIVSKMFSLSNMKDIFHPYGDVKEGVKTRGQYGFMKVIKVYDEPHFKYGKFIAKSITWEEANADLKR